jgi:hypothetical protein
MLGITCWLLLCLWYEPMKTWDVGTKCSEFVTCNSKWKKSEKSYLLLWIIFIVLHLHKSFNSDILHWRNSTKYSRKSEENVLMISQALLQNTDSFYKTPPYMEVRNIYCCPSSIICGQVTFSTQCLLGNITSRQGVLAYKRGNKPLIPFYQPRQFIISYLHYISGRIINFFSTNSP